MTKIIEIIQREIHRRCNPRSLDSHYLVSVQFGHTQRFVWEEVLLHIRNDNNYRRDCIEDKLNGSW